MKIHQTISSSDSLHRTFRPKTLLQSINSSKSYADLLHILEEKAFSTLQSLRAIFTSEKIRKILGPDFQPLIYQNKGALLIALLRKLQKIKTVRSSPELKSSIEVYLQAIEVPSMNIYVFEDNLVKMKSETADHSLN